MVSTTSRTPPTSSPRRASPGFFFCSPMLLLLTAAVLVVVIGCWHQHASAFAVVPISYTKEPSTAESSASVPGVLPPPMAAALLLRGRRSGNQRQRQSSSGNRSNSGNRITQPVDMSEARPLWVADQHDQPLGLSVQLANNQPVHFTNLEFLPPPTQQPPPPANNNN